MFRSINASRFSNEATSWGRAFQDTNSTSRISNIELLQLHSKRLQHQDNPHSALPPYPVLYAMKDEGRSHYAQTTSVTRLQTGVEVGEMHFLTFDLEDALSRPPKKWNNNQYKNPYRHTRTAFEIHDKTIILEAIHESIRSDNYKYIKLYPTEKIHPAILYIYNVEPEGGSTLYYTFIYNNETGYFMGKLPNNGKRLINKEGIWQMIEEKKAKQEKERNEQLIIHRQVTGEPWNGIPEWWDGEQWRKYSSANEDYGQVHLPVSLNKRAWTESPPPRQQQRKKHLSRLEPAQTRPSNDRLPVPHSQFPQVADPDMLGRFDWGTLRDAGVDFRTDSVFDNRKSYNNPPPHR